jgi:hypothetical protein
MKAKIAVAGAGIYGTTIAMRLAERGFDLRLFDPLGILHAASAINQYRIHSGYHYPRSPETIRETLEARAEFTETFAPAVVRNSRHYYAIPREGSVTSPDLFEQVMSEFGIAYKPSRPDWMNFGFIDKCYEVEESIYDPDILRDLVTGRLGALHVPFEQRAFTADMREDYDWVVWATYGLGPSRGIFKGAKYQVAEKILIELPAALHHLSLVVVDGPFTAFDPYGSSTRSLFGSAKLTNHWTTTDAKEAIPEPYAGLLNRAEWERASFTRFDAMRKDSALAVPESIHATYVGSRWTIRVVENNPKEDRRTLYVRDGAPGELHIFSGKVVSAVKAARIVCERVAGGSSRPG